MNPGSFVIRLGWNFFRPSDREPPLPHFPVSGWEQPPQPSTQSAPDADTIDHQSPERPWGVVALPPRILIRISTSPTSARCSVLSISGGVGPPANVLNQPRHRVS